VRALFGKVELDHSASVKCIVMPRIFSQASAIAIMFFRSGASQTDPGAEAGGE
jgi:hypothetical protein